jgi:polyphosphate kinase
MTVVGCYQFRVTRDSELTVEDEDLKNLRTALQGELRQRQFGDAVRWKSPTPARRTWKNSCSPSST